MTNEQGGFLVPLMGIHTLMSMMPVRKRFSLSDSAFIGKYSGCRINRITVCRTPINNKVAGALNVITMGKWERAVAASGMDSLFHLYMLLDIINTEGGIVQAVLEKNSTPRCYKYAGDKSNQTETIFVEKQFTGTLRSLLDTTIAQMGDAFWHYDAFTNNCQDFCLNVLGANGLLSERLQNFIKQDVRAIVEDIPSYTTSIAKFATDTDRRIRQLTGRGLLNFY